MTIKPIELFVGDANDGHAELVAASVGEIGVVKNVYRGRSDAEILALAREMERSGKTVTDVSALVFLDEKLPHIDGVGVVRALQRDGRTREIPIVMMTSAYNRQRAEQCRTLGCEAYITKWAVFLGLPPFVVTLKRLAARSASRIASRNCPATPQSHRPLT